ncbi:polymorphic toxin-type HINT domain-containing protein [Paludisphaera rhizosphaerae]|uniref:polymorphic toxin-type HINT domain-containing protein n=1 Tax=Paludisphaera rhizosphaerae TaxID=2711216 RepID=UPI0013ED6167|nr:polymorphic toxin-type HINT domain-containing protein [Paludisphaera rhizosphaerae]
MATRKLSRDDLCHCGSGRKYKKCCLATDEYPRQDYSVEHPQPVYGEGAMLNRTRSECPDPPQPKSIVCIGVDYTFDELFGRAEVRYCFPSGQLVILDDGFVLPVERLEPGMRMRLEDGHIATITNVDEPRTWDPPSRTPDSDGRYARRVLGKIKRTGFVVLDLAVGGQTITTTPGHPFWSVDRGDWIAAGALRIGERLRAGDGATVTVEGKSSLRYGLVELHNIEVEEFHTYFVGRERGGVLVHNGLGGECGIPKPASPDGASGGGRILFRGMREDPSGGPLTGPTARTLGVRPGDDIPMVGDRVQPGTGGMSVAPDSPTNLPEHRRPSEFGGTGKDPVWGIGTDSLGEDIVFRQDKPTHGLLEPAREMSIGEFQEALADLVSRWFKL